MKKPEWKKELDESVSAETTRATNELNSHKNTANIHRAIYISSASPNASEGNDGDVWITYEA